MKPNPQLDCLSMLTGHHQVSYKIVINTVEVTQRTSRSLDIVD